MSGTRKGGLKAAKKCKIKYGADFYQRIGAMGGRLGRTGGFAYEYVDDNGNLIEKGREVARRAGYIGGMVSRRGPSKTNYLENDYSKLEYTHGSRQN